MNFKDKQVDLESSELWETALISVVTKEIGKSGVRLVQDRLLEKYGTTIRQSVQKWEQIEDILRENFGEGSIRISSKLLKEMARLSLKPHEKPNPELKTTQIKLIGDPEISAMLNQVLKNAKIIKEIIRDSKVSQTTAYRKIDKMKEAGLLVDSGYIISPATKKKITKYTSPFESLSLEFKNGKSIIKYGPKKNLKNPNSN